MSENDSAKRFLVFLGSSVVVVAVGWAIEGWKGRKDREEIDEEKKRQLKAIKTAKHRTIRRLKKDKLAHKGLDAVIDEFKFQEIVARFEE